MTTSLPQQFSVVSPYLTVTNIDTATDFYSKAFGFSLKEKAPGEDGTSWHAEMLYQKQMLMFGKEGTYNGKTTKAPNTTKTDSPISMYIYCDDVDKFHQHAIAHGAKSINAPEDMFWGDRMCRLQCPEGYVWAFATHKGLPCDASKNK
jgi:PhnB protein